MKSLEMMIREAVEDVVNDRKGLHWDCLDDEILADLREAVEKAIGKVLREAGH